MACEQGALQKSFPSNKRTFSHGLLAAPSVAEVVFLFTKLRCGNSGWMATTTHISYLFLHDANILLHAEVKHKIFRLKYQKVPDCEWLNGEPHTTWYGLQRKVREGRGWFRLKGDLEERRGPRIGKEWIMVKREIETVWVIVLLLWRDVMIKATCKRKCWIGDLF